MNKKDVINVAKSHITTRFMNMTRDNFEELVAGDGTISVVDEILDMLPTVYRIVNPEVKQIVEEFDETDIEELVQYCITLSDAVYNYFSVTDNNYIKVLDYTLTTEQALASITDMSQIIHETLLDVNKIGKLKAYIDLYTECASTLIDEHYLERQNIAKTLQQLISTLQSVNCLTDDDMSDLFNAYLVEFDEKYQQISHNQYDNIDIDGIEFRLINSIYRSMNNKD